MADTSDTSEVGDTSGSGSAAPTWGIGAARWARATPQAVAIRCCLTISFGSLVTRKCMY